MNKIGVTATRKGLTTRQKNVVADILTRYDEVHHGDCLGGDTEIDDIAARLGLTIVIHPPIKVTFRAFCQYKEDGANRTVLKMKDYLPRNRDIVNMTDVTIGCPQESYEPKPSRGQGTWSTIRYARNQDKLLDVVWP